MEPTTAPARFIGIIQLAARRAVVRATRTNRGQTALSVVGVAAAIALMLLVTSIGVGLTQSAPVVDSGIDYTVEPAGGASSTVVDVGGARLGRVHPVSDRLNARADVNYATPVLMSLVQLSPAEGESRTILLIGVIPTDPSRPIVGLPTESLEAGDPHYADGEYTGPWTGEAVLSEAASDRLGVSTGAELTVESRNERQSFTVTGVSPARQAGLGQFPVGVVHLSELQAVTGGTGSDVADQILVDASGDIKTELAGLYPESRVLTRGELFAGGATAENQLPLAISLAAFIISITVGTLFMMTTMGFELAADRRERAVLAAIGISAGSRIGLVVFQALAIALFGGLVGILLWLGGLVITNAASTMLLNSGTIAAFRPVFVLYGLAVALLIGLLTLPYLLVVSRRSNTTEGLPV